MLKRGAVFEIPDPSVLWPMPGTGKRDVDLFTEAIQLPTEERMAFLDRACAGDEDLRRRIEALLKFNDRVQGVGPYFLNCCLALPK